MAQFVLDTFTGTNGTNLTAHTSNSGGTWSKVTGTTDNIILDGSGNGTTPTSTSGAFYTCSGTPATADYSVQADFTRISATSNIGYEGVIGRVQSGADTFYWFNYSDNSTTPSYQLYKHVAGVNTQIGTTVSTTQWANGSTHTIKISFSGSTIKGYINGTLVVSVVDTSISAAGTAGILLYDQAPGAVFQINGSPTGFIATDAAAAGTVIAVNDTNIFYSPYTWVKNAATSTWTNSTGAYCKFGFTGTSLVTTIDTSTLTSTGLTPASQWPRLLWSIDNGPLQRYLTQTGDSIITLATGISAGSHTVQLWYQFADPAGFDRWNTPNVLLKILSFGLDASSATAACSGTISLQTGRCVIYGDSITEAVYTSNSAVTGGDGTLSYPKALAQALGCEYGQRGFQGQGWTTTGAGNCVPMYTSGNASQSSWNLLDASDSMLSAGLYSPAPDHIIVCHGRNDNSVNQATLATLITLWIAAARTAAPSAQIWMVIPFNHYSITGVTNGTNSYISANTSDTKVHLIDCGLVVGYGLSDVAANQESFDGVHPVQTPHSGNSATLAYLIGSVLSSTGGSGLKRISNNNLSGI